MLKTGAILFWTDMKRLFNWNIDNFKSNFLSRGQLGSKSNDKFFLSVLKMWQCCKYFFGNFFLHLLLERWAKIVLNELKAIIKYFLGGGGGAGVLFNSLYIAVLTFECYYEFFSLTITFQYERDILCMFIY